MNQIPEPTEGADVLARLAGAGLAVLLLALMIALGMTCAEIWRAFGPDILEWMK